MHMKSVLHRDEALERAILLDDIFYIASCLELEGNWPRR
jgi:hypothetical protein